MAVKRFIKRNNKKITCLIALLLVCAVSIVAIISSKTTNASVFKKDKDGNVVRRDTLTVLEIVAQEGQQVIGYTVSGYEPITKEAIENYKGELDVDDFRAATGYEITQEEVSEGVYKTTVIDNLLENTFNLNVLEGNMNSDGGIIVNVKTANAVTATDINNADLVFLNSGDYNQNLLYYYDQIMRNGELGYEKGNYGKTYGDSVVVNQEAKESSISTILAAEANPALASKITATDYILSGVKDFNYYNLDAYNEALGALTEGTLSNDNQKVVINNIYEAIIRPVNNRERTVASDETYSGASLEKMYTNLMKIGINHVVEANVDVYYDKMTSSDYYYDRKLTQELVDTMNDEEKVNGINNLKIIKATGYTIPTKEVDGKEVQDIEHIVINDESLHSDEEGADFKLIKDSLTKAMYDYSSYNEDVVSSYANGYLNMDLTESPATAGQLDDAAVAEIQSEVIDVVNASLQDQYLKIFAQLPGNSSAIEEFKEGLAIKLGIISGKLKTGSYVDYYATRYMDELAKLSSEDDIFGASSEQGYDLDKIQEFFDEINGSDYYVDRLVNMDMSWSAALSLYKYAQEDQKALMYNTQLLKDEGAEQNPDALFNDLGIIKNCNYEVTNYDYNTNNLYKILLLLRQVNYDYYKSDLADKIDNEGGYCPEGFDDSGSALGDIIYSWDKNTFGNPDTDTQHKMFREPDVVGQTYDGTTAGGNTNYIYKRIYSFTGQQFFGGEAFNLPSKGEKIYHDTGITNDYSSASFITNNGSSGLSNGDKIVLDGSATYLRIDTSSVSNLSVNLDNSVYLEYYYGDANNKFIYDGIKVYPTSISNKVVTFAIPDITNNVYYLGANFHFTASYTDWNGRHTNNYTANLGLNRYYGQFDAGTKVINTYLSGNSLRRIVSTTGSYAYLTNSSADPSVAAEYNTSMTNELKTDYKLGQYWDNSSYYYNCIKCNMEYEMTSYSDAECTNQYLESESGVLNDSQGNLSNITLGKVLNNGSYEDIPNGYYTKVTLYYKTYKGYASLNGVQWDEGTSSEVVTYLYKKTDNISQIKISNFNEDGIVDYYDKIGSDTNTGRTMTVTYSNMTDVKYQLGNNSAVAIASGEEIIVPEDAANEGTKTKLTVTYNYEENGQTKSGTFSTTLYKRKTEYDLLKYNYQLTSTASSETSASESGTASIKATAIDDSDLKSFYDSFGGDTSTIDRGAFVRYILNVTLYEIQNKPLRVLEVQPYEFASDFDSYYAGSDSTDLGVRWLLTSMKIDTSELDELYKKGNKTAYKEYVDVTTVGIRHFNCMEDKLQEYYDLVYIGKNVGPYAYTNSSGRTDFYDDTIDGMVYHGLGDKYNASTYMLGTCASDYKKSSSIAGDFTDRANGNGYGNRTIRYDYNAWINLYSVGLKNNNDSDWNLDSLSGSGDYYNINMSTTGKYARVPGNDITKDRENELLDYLKSGYPVLLDENVYNLDKVDGLYYVDPNSKMADFVNSAKSLVGQNVFADGKNYPSLVSTAYASTSNNPDYLEDSEKTTGGLSYAYKRVGRVGFEAVTVPVQYNKKSDGATERVHNGSTDPTYNANYFSDDYYIDRVNSEGYRTSLPDYTFELKVTTAGITQSYLENNYEYKVYIDRSGIGKFVESKTDELDPKVSYTTDSDGSLKVVLTGKWPTNIEGFVPWKVEAYNKNNPGIKFAKIGFSAFHNIKGENEESAKQDIWVLWIIPSTITSGGNNAAQTSINFSAAVKNHTQAIGDYNIHIISMSYAQVLAYYDSYFENKVSTDKLYSGNYFNSDTTLMKVAKVRDYLTVNSVNSNSYNYNTKGSVEKVADTREFNMIVMGFHDSLKGGDLDSPWCIEDIKWFVTNGKHSLLFTHDDASFTTTVNNFTTDSGRVTNGVVNADGSNWLFSKYITAGFRNLVGQDAYGVTESDSNLSQATIDARSNLNITNQQDLRGYTEFLVVNYQNGSGWGRLYNKSNANLSDSGMTWIHTFTIDKVNMGQITEYPYVIGDTATVKRTHVQYLALNLEDEDTTVWYTLGYHGENYGINNVNYYRVNRYDGQNNYYIYTNGNVTFTSAGHDNSGGLSGDEMNLFVNTIVFAIKQGSMDPDVEITNSYELSSGSKAIDMYTEDNGVYVKFRGIDFNSSSGTAAFDKVKVVIDGDGDGVVVDSAGRVDTSSGQNNIILSSEEEGTDFRIYNSRDDVAANNPMIFDNESVLNRKEYTFYIDKNQFDVGNPKVEAAIERYNAGVSDADKITDAKDFLYSSKVYVVVTIKDSETGDVTVASDNVSIVKQYIKGTFDLE